MATIEVSTSQYEFAHGRRPAGRGYWAFFFDGQTDVNQAFFSGRAQLYSQALKDAKAYAKEHGHTSITIGS